MISTKVGGVPEVLPSDMIHLAEPDVSGEQKFSMIFEALKSVNA